VDACVCGGGYYLLRSMQPGPFSCLDPPIPSVPALQLANALPPVPDLRVCSQTFPYASFITRHTTDHSFSLPERKRPGYAPCYMLHPLCLCVWARPATGSRHGCLPFPRGKACRGCSVCNLGRTGICLLLSFLELSAIGIRHRIKDGAAGHGGRARVVHGLSAC